MIASQRTLRSFSASTWQPGAVSTQPLCKYQEQLFIEHGLRGLNLFSAESESFPNLKF